MTDPLTPHGGEDKIARYVRYLRDVGFPIAVAVYLLVRLDLLIRENTAALWALKVAVDALSAAK